MSKHTPGPWTWDKTEVISVSAAGVETVVADVLADNYKADARLIAAAPELLAAAEELLAAATKFGFVDESYSALPVIHEAIVKLARACRKAEGGGE